MRYWATITLSDEELREILDLEPSDSLAEKIREHLDVADSYQEAALRSERLNQRLVWAREMRELFDRSPE